CMKQTNTYSLLSNPSVNVLHGQSVLRAKQRCYSQVLTRRYVMENVFVWRLPVQMSSVNYFPESKLLLRVFISKVYTLVVKIRMGQVNLSFPPHINCSGIKMLSMS